MCGVSSSMCITDINRIKVEFKGGNLQRREGVYLILIESKWNLKHIYKPSFFYFVFILIESKWNLKDAHLHCCNLDFFILIESKWNLKRYLIGNDKFRAKILIESKWNLKDKALEYGLIDRIILIESKWNLKVLPSQLLRQLLNINRIKVEFKGDTGYKK